MSERHETAAAAATTVIPIIDVAAFFDGGDVHGVAEAVAAACRDVGFFVITGHGVDPSVLAAARTDAASFFAMDSERKAAYQSNSFCGYSPFKNERLAYSRGEETPPDLKEAFTVSRPDITDDPYFHAPQAQSLFPTNVYPTEQPTFEASAVTLNRTLGELAEAVMEIFATGLGLPQLYFAPMLDKHFSFLRFVNYPAPGEVALPGQLRAGAHTDYGSLTFVDVEEAPGGLQVLGPDGQWIDVPVVPGGLVVNLGDLLQRWTNDAWRSTMHRVAVPDEDRWTNSGRLSIVYFHETNWDAEIVALDACTSADNPPRYPATTAGQHNYERVIRQQTLTTPTGQEIPDE